MLLLFVDVCVRVMRCYECICLLYVRCGSKLGHRTLDRAMLFIVWYILLLYSTGSGMNRVQVVLVDYEIVMFCPSKNNL